MPPVHFNKTTNESPPTVTFGEPPTVVLDTNVILDWLLFADPLLDSFANAICGNQITLLTHAPALHELQRVLSYDRFKLDDTRQKTLLDRYRQHTRDCALPTGFSVSNLLLPPNFPICKDPDDQHFLALAYHMHANALVTRDRALLALRKRALKFGLVVVDVRQLSTVLRDWLA